MAAIISEILNNFAPLKASYVILKAIPNFRGPQRNGTTIITMRQNRQLIIKDGSQNNGST